MELTREELEQIPPRYRWLLRLLLKLPNPSVPFFILKKLPEFEGVFWALIAPIFLLIYFFFSIWLVAYLSLNVVFPINYLLSIVIPAIIFAFFLRIQLERTVLWWKSIHAQPREWNVSKTVEELIEVLKKQRKRK